MLERGYRCSYHVERGTLVLASLSYLRLVDDEMYLLQSNKQSDRKQQDRNGGGTYFPPFLALWSRETLSDQIGIDLLRGLGNTVRAEDASIESNI